MVKDHIRRQPGDRRVDMVMPYLDELALRLRQGEESMIVHGIDLAMGQTHEIDQIWVLGQVALANGAGGNHGVIDDLPRLIVIDGRKNGMKGVQIRNLALRQRGRQAGTLIERIRRLPVQREMDLRQPIPLVRGYLRVHQVGPIRRGMNVIELSIA